MSTTFDNQSYDKNLNILVCFIFMIWDLLKILIDPNFDPMGVSKAQNKTSKNIIICL